MAEASALMRWAKRAAIGIGLIVALAMLGVLGLVWPHVRDDFVLDRAVAAAALDWRDFGRDRGQERLLYELDAQQIGESVGDDDCALTEPETGVLRIDCAWHVDVVLPGTSLALPLAFSSKAEIGPDGDLRRP